MLLSCLSLNVYPPDWYNNSVLTDWMLCQKVLLLLFSDNQIQRLQVGECYCASAWYIRHVFVAKFNTTLVE